MTGSIRELIAQLNPITATPELDEKLSEWLALPTAEQLKVIKICLSELGKAELQLEAALTVLDKLTASRGLNVPSRTQDAKKRRRGKPRMNSRLPEGLTTKEAGKFAYWRKVRARKAGKTLTNLQAAEEELRHLLRGQEPTTSEIKDVAKRISESENRQE